MASLLVLSLNSSLNGSIFFIHDERKTIHLIVFQKANLILTEIPMCTYIYLSIAIFE